MILIEPDYENGNLAQKLYLLYYDYLRDLPEVLRKELGPRARITHKKLPNYGNPLNLSSLTVIMLN